MRGALLGMVMAAGAVMGITACDNLAGGATIEGACTAICECFGAMGPDLTACVGECTAEAPPGLPEACLDCLVTATCPVTQACEVECDLEDDQPPPMP